MCPASPASMKSDPQSAAKPRARSTETSGSVVEQTTSEGKGRGSVGTLRERKRFLGNRVALEIGRRDEESAAHLGVLEPQLRGMDDRRNRERVADQDDRAGREHDLLVDAIHPVGEHGRVPVGLLDEEGIGHPLAPAALPVVRAGIAEAGRDQDVGFGDLHLSSVRGR